MIMQAAHALSCLKVRNEECNEATRSTTWREARQLINEREHLEKDYTLSSHEAADRERH